MAKKDDAPAKPVRVKRRDDKPSLDERLTALEQQVEKLWLHIDHFLPFEGPEIPDHLKDTEPSPPFPEPAPEQSPPEPESAPSPAKKKKD